MLSIIPTSQVIIVLFYLLLGWHVLWLGLLYFFRLVIFLGRYLRLFVMLLIVLICICEWLLSEATVVILLLICSTPSENLLV